jgi:hypothetical protein
MKKRIVGILIAPVFVGLFFLPAFSQEDMEMIDDGGFTKKQRSPVVFRHDEHNELAELEDCIECHHVYEDGKKLEDESSEDLSCSECHEENSSGEQPGLRKAFHMNCKGCHLENEKGPVMCGQCHVR